jgi:hypothetical protein
MPHREDGFYEQGGGWVAGVDFDPSDPDEMEIMHAVWDQEKHDKIRLLEDENERLRQALNEKNGVDD